MNCRCKQVAFSLMEGMRLLLLCVHHSLRDELALTLCVVCDDEQSSTFREKWRIVRMAARDCFCAACELVAARCPGRGGV